MDRFAGLLGLVAIMGGVYACSKSRKGIKPSLIAWGMGLQFLFAFLVLKTPLGQVFQALSVIVNNLIGYVQSGSEFLFGPLGRADGPMMVVFAFQVLPIIVFIASLFSILYFLGIMQIVIRFMAMFMQRTMRISGAEATNVAASLFMGQTEAPLTIRPFLPKFTESELFTIMVSGMAHVSGATMAAYVQMAHVEIQHLLTAVIMTAPATIMLAKMLIPETGVPETSGQINIEVEKPGVNIIDAAARGAGDGGQLALNIAFMLVAFLSLIAMVNGIFAWVHSWASLVPSSLEALLGIIFAPIAWLLGVTAKDAQAIGNLLGTRMVLNEFVAFSQLGPLKETLDPKSFTIATYALCGFANLSSIAMQIGGIGALAPTRKSDLARLGVRAMIIGTLANFMSACIAGILL
jgi:CNT family concentrative nucleoside transporter